MISKKEFWEISEFLFIMALASLVRETRETKKHPGPLYYVAGEYQGKYKIQGDQVFSVNQQVKTKAMVAGQDLNSFKEEIKRFISENE